DRIAEVNVERHALNRFSAWIEMEWGIDVRAVVHAHVDRADIHRRVLRHLPFQLEMKRRVPRPWCEIVRKGARDIENLHHVSSSMIVRAAFSLAPLSPSFAMIASNSSVIRSRAAWSLNNFETASEIFSGRASYWTNSGTISRPARTFGMPRCSVFITRRAAK